MFSEESNMRNNLTQSSVQIFKSDCYPAITCETTKHSPLSRANLQKWLLSSDNMRNDQTQPIVSCKSSKVTTIKRTYFNQTLGVRLRQHIKAVMWSLSHNELLALLYVLKLVQYTKFLKFCWFRTIRYHIITEHLLILLYWYKLLPLLTFLVIFDRYFGKFHESKISRV